MSENKTEYQAFYTDGPAKNFEPVEPVAIEELDEAKSPLLPDDKRWFMAFLGFQGRGKDQWWHPILGPDTAGNRMRFDCVNEEPYMLVSRIYKLGGASLRKAIDELINPIPE